SGTKPLPAVANLKDHLALYHVEPFILVKVEMKRWAPLHQVGVLDNEQTATCVARRHLEQNGAEAAAVSFSKPVLPRADHVNLSRRCGARGLGKGEVLKSSGRKQGGSGFNEQSRIH